jgi:hypothetical protein
MDNKKRDADLSVEVAKFIVKRNGCVKTDLSMLKELEETVPNHFYWHREKSIEFVDLDLLFSIYRFNENYLISFRESDETSNTITSQFMITEEVYKNIVSTLKERNRYDILIKVGMLDE